YSPATSAVMYVDMGAVGAKSQRATLSATITGSGVGELDTTCQCAGAVTWNGNVAFKSGCSKVANTRRASGTSNWVYRYTRSSAGSTKRCRPSPEREYLQVPSTRNTLWDSS